VDRGPKTCFSTVISCWQYLLLKNFEVVGLEDPVVGQMQGRQSRGLLCQVADQLEVEVSVEEDEAADLKFSEDKKNNIYITLKSDRC